MATKATRREIPAAAGARTIRIRMYRVGFGDCFLITFPDRRHILVDCGVHARGDIHTLQRAVQDIVAETEGRIALLIATHAHQDHISGFAAFEESFRQMTIGEVWLPWTEDPSNPQAKKLRRKQMALVEQVASHLRLTGAENGPAMSALLNIAGNERALQNLHNGFGSAKVRYVEQGDEARRPGDIAGLDVHVLGPPRDQEFLARMDPPAGQRYLRLGAKGAKEAAGVKPFRSKWITRRTAAVLSKHDRERLDTVAAVPAADLAFALDAALNNTSIVTVFSYSGRQLLFPGDAQYGNWQAWLREEGSADILGGIDFYKVAHHGSFNATPRKALEQMRAGRFGAMISTQNAPWPSIPLPKLVQAIERQTGGRVVRSDSLAIAGAPRGPAIKKLPPLFSKGSFWYDYTLAI